MFSLLTWLYNKSKDKWNYKWNDEINNQQIILIIRNYEYSIFRLCHLITIQKTFPLVSRIKNPLSYSNFWFLGPARIVTVMLNLEHVKSRTAFDHQNNLKCHRMPRRWAWLKPPEAKQDNFAHQMLSECHRILRRWAWLLNLHFSYSP